MGLNIKNPETEQSIRELASAMGLSLTEAVERAVREKLHSLRREAFVKSEMDALLKIANDSASRFSEAEKKFDWDGHLYDENGLPK
jgi:hypothetical protein